ncbi:DUF3325 family protein [Alkalilimnicola ehrlichii]|nr:DUF3325 family protein [Alkalilimnicola ehrlichii]
MVDGMLLAVIVVCAYLGMAMLALSQPPHWRRVAGEPGAPPGCPRRPRRIAVLLLAASLVVALLRDGPVFGSVLWVMVLSAAAAAVAVTLAWQPRTLAQLVRLVDSAHRG